MCWNRFDIVEAHYWFAAHYHGGQASDLYLRLCRISRRFGPGACANGPSTENACVIYGNLEAKHGFKVTPYEVLASGEARLVSL